MKPGPLPDALKPGFHCVTTHWIPGFMAFWLARRMGVGPAGRYGYPAACPERQDVLMGDVRGRKGGCR